MYRFGGNRGRRPQRRFDARNVIIQNAHIDQLVCHGVYYNTQGAPDENWRIPPFRNARNPRQHPYQQPNQFQRSPYSTRHDESWRNRNRAQSDDAYRDVPEERPEGFSPILSPQHNEGNRNIPEAPPDDLDIQFDSPPREQGDASEHTQEENDEALSPIRTYPARSVSGSGSNPESLHTAYSPSLHTAASPTGSMMDVSQLSLQRPPLNPADHLNVSNRQARKLFNHSEQMIALSSRIECSKKLKLREAQLDAVMLLRNELQRRRNDVIAEQFRQSMPEFRTLSDVYYQCAEEFRKK